MDWFDLLAIQGTLKSLLQHHSLKTSIHWCSAVFKAQLSHPYITTWKTTALTIWTFASKVVSLLFNMLSRLVIAFLPRSKHLLISWLQSPSTMILEPKKIKSVTVSIASLSICHEVMGPDATIFIFWMLIFKPTFSDWNKNLVYMIKKAGLCPKPRETVRKSLLASLLPPLCCLFRNSLGWWEPLVDGNLLFLTLEIYSRHPDLVMWILGTPA